MAGKKHKKVEKELREEIEIPEGLVASLEGDEIVMKKGDKELRRKLDPRFEVKVEGSKVMLNSSKTTRREKRMFGTVKAHIRNMIRGLTEGFKYELEVANVHFPMNVSYDKESNDLVVKNFLGEKKDRRIRLTEDVDVNVNKNIVEVTSHNIERAGQAATNIEKGTRVRNKDRRIYQDGIYIVKKPGREFK
jgi:large subunit ribosomal protein L6